MRFSTRNAFYLRVSNYRVIPLFLYLDERHVDWMTDPVLQLVMAELQHKMAELLLLGRHEKKHKVHVERGDGYQYCYFLRTTTRTEVVLLKQKEYSLRPPSPPPPPTPIREQTPRRRGPASASSTPSKRRRTTRSRSASVRDETPSLVEVNDPDIPEESELSVKAEPLDPDERFTPPRADSDEDGEDERGIKDWKPDVSVTYKGFGTSSVQLVLIIEPYPPLPASEYAPPSSRLSSRSTSIAASRSRSRQAGTGLAGRYSSTSLSVAPDSRARSQTVHAPNMRNASRSVSVANSRRGGASVTPGPGAEDGRGQTPLFMPRDTPFGEDDEDEEAHLAYLSALREGRLRLPSVDHPAGSQQPKQRREERRSVRRTMEEYGEEDEDDVPEGMMEIGTRLVRGAEIEEGVRRVVGGWEERAEGEVSDVLGREEPGE